MYLYTLYGLSSHFFTVTDIALPGSMPMTRVYTCLETRNGAWLVLATYVRADTLSGRIQKYKADAWLDFNWHNSGSTLSILCWKELVQFFVRQKSTVYRLERIWFAKH